MTPLDWLSLVACVAILPLAVLALQQRGRSPMALPVALLCFDIFVWNFATWAFNYSGNSAWLRLDGSFSAFTPPLALHAVLAFVGRTRRLRRVLVAAYVVYGGLSAWAIAITYRSPLAWLADDNWSLVFLFLWIPLLVLEVILLLRHLRQSSRHDEQMRTRWLIASVAIGGIFGSTEFWDHLWAVPALGHMASLLSMALIAMVVLRWQLFNRDLSSRVAIYAGALALVGVTGYLTVFQALQANTALLVLGTASVTFVLFVAARDVWNSAASQRERMRHLASLGRFSAQMAHDLKNPLASISGSLQFLAEERAQGRSVDEHHSFLQIMSDQVHRMELTVERYQRMSRVEPELHAESLRELVDDVLAAHSQRQDADLGIETRLDIADGLPLVPIDRDLVTNALENLVQNAIEAMPQGGLLTLRCSLGAEGRMARLVVEDSGEGMDARLLERATDDFHTTKATGTGLGLAFARRVAEAHGGELRLTSSLGEGTTVELRLPIEPDE